jgi:uncharacterized membrane protein YgdD (TMEM256/DUF423 family)
VLISKIELAKAPECEPILLVMLNFNNEDRFWVAFGGAFMGLSILLAAFGRHGLESAEVQMRWGIAVQYLRFMAVGIMGMTVLRCVFHGTPATPWPERMLALGTVAFSSTLLAECIWPKASWVETVGIVAPVGGMLMIISWLVFVFQFIRATGPLRLE